MTKKEIDMVYSHSNYYEIIKAAKAIISNFAALKSRISNDE